MNDKSKSEVMQVVELWSDRRPFRSTEVDMCNVDFDREAVGKMHRIMHDAVVEIAGGTDAVTALRFALMYARELRDGYEADHWLELHAGDIGYATLDEFESMSAVRKKTYSMYKEFATAIFKTIRDVQAAGLDRQDDGDDDDKS